MIFHLTNCNINHNFISPINQELKIPILDLFINIVKYGACVLIPNFKNMKIKHAII